MLQAATQGDLEQLNLLIARGDDINAATANGAPPIAITAQYGRLEAAQLLLDAGAQLNKDTPFGTPLIIATSRLNQEMVTLFLEKGADPNQADRTGRTALLVAVEYQQMDLVKLLVEKGADVNAADTRGRTPMSLANRGRDVEIADYLRSKGAQELAVADPRDIYGRSAGPAVSSHSYRTATDEPDILEDPNAITAKVAAFPDVAAMLKTFDANCASEERNWATRRNDNRQLLLRAVAKQVADELAFLKGLATTENADQTVAAIDELASARTARYDAIADDLREERRQALIEAREQAGRGRGRGTRGRGMRGGAQAYEDPQMSAAGPYADPRAARPRPGSPPEDERVVLDADGEGQRQAWLSADPEDKRTLLTAVHELDLLELDFLRQSAVEEEAAKTTAAIEGLMLARQRRLERINTTMTEYDERMQRLAERTGTTMGPTRGRGGRGATTQPLEPTTPRRRRR